MIAAIPARTLGVVLPLLLLIPACRSKAPETVLARVGDLELTLEEARSHIDTTQQPLQSQLRRYVDHWVTTALLCQQARREGLGKEEPVAGRIREADDQLLAEALLERHIYDDTAAVADSLLRSYFANHAGEFLIREDMVRLNLLTLRSRERANAFAALVSKGSSWNDALAALQRDTTGQPGMIENVSGRWYSQRTLFPPELWRVASALNVSDVSFPVRTGTGYCVLELLQKAQAGKQADFEIARDEVRARVTVERQRQRYDELLGTLHKRYSVEILLGFESPSDTGRGNHHE